MKKILVGIEARRKLRLSTSCSGTAHLYSRSESSLKKETTTKKKKRL